MQNILPDFLITPGVIIIDKELQPLDGYVYGVVYWYKKMKLEKCVASNETIAGLLHIKNSRSVSNSLTRLKKKGYVEVIMDPRTNQRLEIIPLVFFTPFHQMMTPPSSNNDGPSSNDEHNNNIYKEELIIPLTVRKKESVLKKLPNLDLLEEHKNYLVTVIIDFLKDKKSESYYKLVVSKVPEQIIREALSEIKHDGANSPEKVFTSRMEIYGLTQLNKI